ncbi:tyrosine-type recombinase/integrase [Streptomyces acidicola]|uniref:Site-specific integrase n=1 Tax=Streptomyces acidicola TaxID=2596892 RepID=A0A5N8WIJ9_9ACTN|nr:site-specific integrase [Streptomyces acidicola]MPY47059.1 site-specific integrase [Streptomyces acidicola]MPY47198.1 site-specific integrase [Streptomyces acidicola]
MPGYIEDRWYKKGVDPDTKKVIQIPTERHGKGKRYKVTGIPGVRSRSFPDGQKAAAKDWLANAQSDTIRGQFYDPRDGSITLDEYVRKHWWPTVRYPPTTKASVRSRVFGHILPHAGALSLNRIGFDEVRAWQSRAEQDIDVGTLVVTWAHFSSILQAAHKAKRIPANPFRDPELRAPRLPKSKALAWPQDTVTMVQEELPDRYGILVSLGAGAGLRQGEALGFSPDDVDGEDIHVVRQIIKVNGRFGFGPPKGNKERAAPCTPELAEAIKEYANRFPSVEVTLPWVDPARPSLAWEDRPKRTVRLLVTTQFRNGVNGGAINKDTFNEKHWKPALAAAGMIPQPEVTYIEPKKGRSPWRKETWTMPREFGFHVLRHTFASVVLAEGETITQLAAWLGHSDPAFTLRTYVHFMPKSGSRGRAALGRLVSGVAPEAGESPESPDTALQSGSPQTLPSSDGS